MSSGCVKLRPVTGLLYRTDTINRPKRLKLTRLRYALHIFTRFAALLSSRLSTATESSRHNPLCHALVRFPRVSHSHESHGLVSSNMRPRGATHRWLHLSNNASGVNCGALCVNHSQCQTIYKCRGVSSQEYRSLSRSYGLLLHRPLTRRVHSLCVSHQLLTLTSNTTCPILDPSSNIARHRQ